jgi:hypothetical protein
MLELQYLPNKMCIQNDMEPVQYYHIRQKLARSFKLFKHVAICDPSVRSHAYSHTEAKAHHHTVEQHLKRSSRTKA